MASDIYKSNNWDWSSAITTDDPATGEPSAATAVADLNVWISATENGSEIHADLKVLATERSGLPGEYYATIDGDKINTHLFGAGASDYNRKMVHVVVESLIRNIRFTMPRRCYAVRRVGVAR